MRQLSVPRTSLRNSFMNNGPSLPQTKVDDDLSAIMRRRREMADNPDAAPPPTPRRTVAAAPSTMTMDSGTRADDEADEESSNNTFVEEYEDVEEVFEGSSHDNQLNRSIKENLMESSVSGHGFADTDVEDVSEEVIEEEEEELELEEEEVEEELDDNYTTDDGLSGEYETGDEDYETGDEEYETGDEVYQTGDEAYQTGNEEFETGDEEYQTGDEEYETGDEEYETGDDEFEGGEEYQTGDEDYETGDEDYQTGEEEYIEEGECVDEYQRSRGTPERQDSFFVDPSDDEADIPDWGTTDVDEEEVLEDEDVLDTITEEDSQMRSHADTTYVGETPTVLAGVTEDETIEVEEEEEEYTVDGSGVYSTDQYSTEYEQDDYDSGEDDPVYEIETVESSVYSGDDEGVEDNGGASSLLDQHFSSNKPEPTAENKAEMFETGSILEEHNVLGIVHEADNEDESQLFSKDGNSDKDEASNGEKSKPEVNEEFDTRSSSEFFTSEDKKDRNVPLGSGDEQTKSTRQSKDGDLESQTRYRRQSSASKKAGILSFCSLPWIVLSVLVVSLCLGLGVGLLFFRSDNEEVAFSEEISPEQRAAFDTICPLLKDCSVLVDSESPQGKAFEWLTNNEEANPSMEDFDEIRLTERYALATFYYSTTGEEWMNDGGWLSAAHECEWFSSAEDGPCDDDRKFVRLELDNNNLNGELPAELSLLTNLKVLHLSNPEGALPSLTGPMPSELGDLKMLEKMIITGNSFSSGIPEELGELSSLVELDLHQNGFNGKIPVGFVTLEALERLNLSGNFLAGSVESGVFGDASSLVEMDLSGNRLTELPDSVAQLSNLVTLRLGSNQFLEFPLILTEMENLRHLDLSDCRMRGALPSRVGSMHLETLLLNNNVLTSIPFEIQNIEELKFLDLSNNSIEGNFPELQESLEHLFLQNNRFSGNIPESLAYLVHLDEIRIDGNNLEGEVPSPVCMLFDSSKPTAYADCDKLENATCFNFCCQNGDCSCQYETIDPFRCLLNRG